MLLRHSILTMDGIRERVKIFSDELSKKREEFERGEGREKQVRSNSLHFLMSF